MLIQEFQFWGGDAETIHPSGAKASLIWHDLRGAKAALYQRCNRLSWLFSAACSVVPSVLFLLSFRTSFSR